MSIVDKLGKEVIFFDGALGTMLQERVAHMSNFEDLNIEKPQLIKEIHKLYLEAGADVITANTFGANDYKLIKSKYTVEEIVEHGIKNAKEVAGGAYVALDIGPIGKMVEPLGQLTFDEAYSQFQKQVIAGQNAGCDLILIETMSDIMEAKIAVLAAKENSNVPVICTMTFGENCKTFTGVEPITMVSVLEGLGVDALGVNCSFGPEKLVDVVRQLMEYATIPVILQPNAGIPIVKEGKVSYHTTKEDFSSSMSQMVELGVSIVGGCCGTTPEHIAQCKKVLGDRVISHRKTNGQTIASASRSSVVFKELTIMGEALVPTGRKRYTQALEVGKDMFFVTSAKEQKKLGAQIININVSTPGIDEKAAMLRGVKRISASVDIPLQIDSIHPDIIEAALRVYPGKAVVNSVNGSAKSMDTIFPIAKKYGCLLIGMVFDERGICEGVKERVEIAKKIVNTAAKYEINRKDIIIDCLSLSAKAYQDNLMDTLEVVKQVKETLGVKTMLGVSNVSYGLPRRSVIDSTYLALALAKGLDVVMMSVYDKTMIETIEAFDIITNKDKGALRYRGKYSTSDMSTELASPVERSKMRSFKIVIASVKGDTINNGKNVIKKALASEGHYLEDLGLDVDKEIILEKARDGKADIIALSAFAPYSLESLKDTVSYIKREAPNFKIMVGGASVREEYAKEIGADIYGLNAIETIKKLATL